MTPWTKATIQRAGTAIVLEGKNAGFLRLVDLQAILGHIPDPFCEHKPAIESVNIDGTRLLLTVSGQDYSCSQKQIAAHQNQIRVLHNSSFILSANAPDLGLKKNASLILHGQNIAWVGNHHDIEQSGIDLSDAQYIDLQRRLVTPGLVDCHAHPLFAGQRSGEFSRRARGDHYLDIAKEGGGINATVNPTRTASFEEHVALCQKRMNYALGCGTTTMEAKSGYDLSVEGELRLLRAAQVVDALQSVDLMPTLLGAHVIPAEFKEKRDAYVDSVISQMIPRAASEHLALAVDVYCDEGAFTLIETRAILQRAKSEGLAIKAHIGQFVDLGGAQLLAELGALSGDHLEQVSDEGIAAMAKANVIATMLPGACIQLKMQPPPTAKLRKAGVKMAIASDLNPGTSHSESLALPMWLATTHYGMSVEEAWLGVTTYAADALDRQDIGRIAPGCKADLVIWNAETHDEIPYHFGVNLVHQVYKDGRLAT